MKGDVGSTHLFICPTGCGATSAWGTDVYGDDSSVCTAAIHAGVLNVSGGCVVVTIAAGNNRYESSFRNGIKTFSWGSWGRSFTVAVPDEDARTNVIVKQGPKYLFNIRAGRKDDEDGVNVGVIAALVAVTIVAICLSVWTIYLARAYRRSQNMVQRLQSAPGVGVGDTVVVGSPVCPEGENPFESVTGAPFGMPATVVSAGKHAHGNAWGQKDKLEP